MLRWKPNLKSARDIDPYEPKGSALAKRDVIPPVEFVGFDEFGEYPEFRPGDKSMETHHAGSEEHAPLVNIWRRVQ